MGEHDLSSVCCMCGDVGFPAKLFLCTKCCARYQHSYCSNYYNEPGTVCDWCQSEERGGNRMVCRTKLDKKEGGNLSRHENSSSKKNKDGLNSHDKGKNAGAASSSRPANRRFDDDGMVIINMFSSPTYPRLTATMTISVFVGILVFPISVILLAYS